jgi:hypothetical protein
MKNLVKALNNRIVYATAMTMLISSDSFAQGITNTNLKTILNDPNLQTAVTVGFGIFAAFQWFRYFAEFNPGSALLNIILPAVLTFLTFQWNTVLHWFGLM